MVHYGLFSSNPGYGGQFYFIGFLYEEEMEDFKKKTYSGFTLHPAYCQDGEEDDAADEMDWCLPDLNITVEYDQSKGYYVEESISKAFRQMEREKIKAQLEEAEKYYDWEGDYTDSQPPNGYYY